MRTLNWILLFLYKIGLGIKVKRLSVEQPQEIVDDFKYHYPWGRSLEGQEHQTFQDWCVSKWGLSYELLTQNIRGIEERWDGGGTYRYSHVSGMLWSTKTFLYGSFEAKIYIPKGYGMWPAFWLFGANDERFGEIDIFEYYGHNHRFTYNTHAGKDYGHNLYGKSNGIRLKRLEDSSHYYRVDWRKKWIKFYIDNILVGIRSAKHLDIPMNLIISSGIKDIDLDRSNKDLPNTMNVCRIKYYY